MIEIKVTKSNNTDFLGNYKFNKNLIYVGSNHDSDLYFPNTKLIRNHIFIEVIENKLLTHINQSCDYILVNKKRTTKFKVLKVGDILELEDIQLCITKFETTNYQTKKDALNNTAKNISKIKPELIPLISRLSNNS